MMVWHCAIPPLEEIKIPNYTEYVDREEPRPQDEAQLHMSQVKSPVKFLCQLKLAGAVHARGNRCFFGICYRTKDLA